MATEYQYDQDDFSATDIDLSVLQSTIEADPAISKTVLNIDRTIDGANFTIRINFDGALDGAEQTALNSIVTGYTDDQPSNDQYFIICDRKPAGTNGGTFANDVWATRDLNYVDGSAEYVTLSSNQFILQPGRYVVTARVPACNVGGHQSRLVNATDSIYTYGTNADSSKDLMTTSSINAFLTLSTATTFAVEHQCTKTALNIGYGRATGFDADEIYTFISIQRIP